ncbi:MAG TPA: hypothetical protein VII72_11670 [Myxococcota bacterium]|jgi:hypothetical protein
MSRFRIATLLAPLALLLALGGLACGSEESKIDRGVAVDPEVAVPDSPLEDGLSADERLQQETDEEDARSKARFDEAQPPAE